MTFEIFSNDFKKLSENLNNRINLFKINQLNKENHFVYEQNQFDIFLNNIFVNFGKIILVTINKLELKKISIEILKMIKILFEKLISSISKINENSNKLVLKSKALEKKLEDQESFIKLNIKENQELKNEIGKINSALSKILDKPENFVKNSVP